MATFIVTNANDGGAGSLRQAVLDADETTRADTIVFDAGFDGGAEDVIRLTGGQIRIREALTIDGGDGVTITGDAAGNDRTDAGGITDVAASGARRLDDNSRIFDASAALTLDGLTLTGGRTTATDADGGAVRATGELTLTNSTVIGNSTAGDDASGGGIYGLGNITVRNSAISGNSTGGEGGGDGEGTAGGGIYGGDEGVITVRNSMISKNSTAGAFAQGGGIFSVGDLAMRNSMVSGNSTAGDNSGGGGIFMGSGDLSVANSTFSGNSTAGDRADGGAISASGGLGDPSLYRSVSVSNSVISGNSTAGVGSVGGGIHGSGGVEVTVSDSAISVNTAWEGGGIYGGVLDITVKNSSVNGNSAAEGNGGGIFGFDVTVRDGALRGNAAEGGGGGGIFSRYVTLVNSEVSGNTSGDDGGGGIYGSTYYSVSVRNSTISGNRTTGMGGGILGNYVALSSTTVSGNTARDGGGIFGYVEELNFGGRVDLSNSIVVGNVSRVEGSGDLGGDADRVLAGGNIVGRNVFSGSSDVGNTSAKQVFDRTVATGDGVLAGRLADNGGPTRTIALNPDVTNPALGAADPGRAPRRDQRGEPRDTAPDLGAFEAVPVDGLALRGGRRPDALAGAGLADQLYGRGGGDDLRGRAGGDQLRGEAGRDRLQGGRGDDALDGGAGRDRLAGNRGDDRLFGGDGDDRLRGGAGDDLLSGRRGSDAFVFAEDFGDDRVASFDANPAGGQDLIVLRRFGIPPARFSERVRIDDLGEDTLITVDDGGTILLQGVSGAEAIDETDFLL